MTPWQKTCEEIYKERGDKCELCGTPRDIDAPHHAIIRRAKKFRQYLDVKYNLILVCRSHHEHSDADRRRAWKMNCERYGREVMIAWLNGVPMKIKPNIEWMEQ